jgi:hypothetical protein
MQDYETLYNSLGFNIQSDDLNDNEKKELTELVSKFDIEKKEIFYQLILHDWLRHKSNTKVIYPYKIKQQHNDIEIKIDCLPIRVKRILLKFSRLAVASENKDPSNDEVELSAPKVKTVTF